MLNCEEHGNFHVPALCLTSRYMEISVYLALCLVARNKLTEITPITDKFANCFQTWHN